MQGSDWHDFGKQFESDLRSRDGQKVNLNSRAIRAREFERSLDELTSQSLESSVEQIERMVRAIIMREQEVEREKSLRTFAR